MHTEWIYNIVITNIGEACHVPKPNTYTYVYVITNNKAKAKTKFKYKHKIRYVEEKKITQSVKRKNIVHCLPVYATHYTPSQ